VEHERGYDFGFFAWTVPGFLVSVGVIAALSVGPPLFLLGLVLLVYMQVRGPTWPADLGLIAGIGVSFLLLATLAALDGDRHAPWSAIGLALVAVSAGAFWWLRCRRGAAGHRRATSGR